MLRRLHPEQPDTFAFTAANQTWAEGQIAKYPEGRAASAVIPLLWRAQEQEGWVTKPAIEVIAGMLGLATIRVLEVASFYFMFQLKPVGSVAHIQVCGTTSCMICGAEDLVAVCKERIAPQAHQLSDDGKFSWEEVECLGACANAPMAQIGKDYYEDLSAESFGEILDGFARGEVPPPGSRKGRFAAEPLGGLTSLTEFAGGHAANASVEQAAHWGDTIKRITGDEAPVGTTPPKPAPVKASTKAAPNEVPPVDAVSKAKPKTTAKTTPKPKAAAKPKAKPAKEPALAESSAVMVGSKPKGLKAARDGGPDDLKRIKGVGPKLEKLLHSLGYFHFDQLAAWS
ncbi:MAG: NADH-quinone oxidoreductase subunit NuoE, partial [Pseudomonadota bacterium]